MDDAKKAMAMAAAQRVEDDVTRYFESLGFVVDWDCHREMWRGKWYEISDPITKRLLLQIDMHAPLAEIQLDLPLLAEGRPAASVSDLRWEVRGDPEDLRRVAAAMAKGPP